MLNYTINICYYIVVVRLETFRVERNLWLAFVECRFAPRLKFSSYVGDQEKRVNLQHLIKRKDDVHVVLTTYEVCACAIFTMLKVKGDICFNG